MTQILWPERPTCHDGNYLARKFGASTWRPAGVRLHPDYDHVPAFRSCSYCGSMHPEDLIAAINAGAKLGGSDWKYGWPHKFYVSGIPNPNAGNLVTTVHGSTAELTDDERAERGRSYVNNGGDITWERDPRGGWLYSARLPDDRTTNGKWYNEHLKDLSADAFAELAPLLHQHAGILFEREADGRVRYTSPSAGYQS